MVMPPLPALLSDPTLQMAGNERPFLRSVFLNELFDQRIFFGSPRAFDETRFQNFLPTVEALYFGASWKIRGDESPILWTVLVDSTAENVILSCGMGGRDPYDL